MRQCYFAFLFIFYSAPLIIESTPLRENALIHRSDPISYSALEPSKPPILPGKWGRVGKWLILVSQILLNGILVGLNLAVMSSDKTHLRVWMNTGGEKQRSTLDLHISIKETNSLSRKFAKRILTIRSHPNWLLVTLIITSVMVAQGLPWTLSFLKPSMPPWTSFFFSTTSVVLLGEIMPQALVPPWILEVGGRAFWFLRCLMWILAVPACIPAYALRKAREWRGTKYLDRRDGILDLDEMIEFVRLHQHGCGYSGPLTDECGSLVRAVLSGQHRLIVDDVRPWIHFTILDVNAQLDAMVLEHIWSCNDPYILVVKNTITEIRPCLGEEEGSQGKNKPPEQLATHEFILYGLLLQRVLSLRTIEIYL